MKHANDWLAVKLIVASAFQKCGRIFEKVTSNENGASGTCAALILQNRFRFRSDLWWRTNAFDKTSLERDAENV